MVNIPKRAIILSLKLFLLGFLYSHTIFPNGWFYFGGAILLSPIITVISIYLLLDEVETIIQLQTDVAV